MNAHDIPAGQPRLEPPLEGEHLRPYLEHVQALAAVSGSAALQILEDGHWVDVVTRARTPEGMKRVYRRMCRENPQGSPYGMRIITVQFEHLGRLPNADMEARRQ